MVTKTSVYRFKTPPCVRSIRPRVCTTRTCVETHVRVVPACTGTFSMHTRRRFAWTPGGFSACHTTSHNNVTTRQHDNTQQSTTQHKAALSSHTQHNTARTFKTQTWATEHNATQLTPNPHRTHTRPTLPHTNTTGQHPHRWFTCAVTVFSN